MWPLVGGGKKEIRVIPCRLFSAVAVVDIEIQYRHLLQPVSGAGMEGAVMGINYGFDKVRFINPVKVGKRIRVSSVLAGAELKGDQIQLTRSMTVEIEGEDKPALIAEWITRSVYA